MWEDFRAKCLKSRPDWNNLVKMCARWHIKGSCFDTCQRAISHVPCSKVPPKEKKNFLTFMGEYRACITPDKNDWLIRSGPSGARPPKKPPEIIIPKKIPLPFDFEFKPLSLQIILKFLPQGPLCDTSIWARRSKPVVAIDNSKTERETRDHKAKSTSWGNARRNNSTGEFNDWWIVWFTFPFNRTQESVKFDRSCRSINSKHPIANIASKHPTTNWACRRAFH